MNSKELNEQLLMIIPSLRSKFDEICKCAEGIETGSTIVMEDVFLPYVIEHLQSRSTKFIIDTGGDALLEILPYHPFLIKPNHTELCALFNEDYNPSDIKGLTGAAKHLQEKGARNVMISLGAEGAVLVTEDGAEVLSW